MPLELAIPLFCLAGYFLVAAAYPRVRLRWAIRKTWSLISFGTRAPSTTVYRGPHLGSITCIGLTLVFGGFGLQRIPGAPTLEIIGAGIVLVTLGFFRDHY